MDLTEILMQLEEITGLPVYLDMCTDEDAEMYIVYVYQDERPTLCGDNKVLADRCDIYVNLYTPIHYDYFKMKRKIRDYLEGCDFVVNSINSRVETYEAKKVRRTTYDCRYAAFRE